MLGVVVDEHIVRGRLGGYQAGVLGHGTCSVDLSLVIHLMNDVDLGLASVRV